MTGRELAYIAEAHSCGHLAGDGPFTRRSHAWLEQQTGCRKALLTPSCTAALEMMALLLDIEERDSEIDDHATDTGTILTIAAAEIDAENITLDPFRNR